MIFTITLHTIKYLGFYVGLALLLSLLYGDWPDHKGNPFWNVVRWITFPLMLAWMFFFMAVGLLR